MKEFQKAIAELVVSGKLVPGNKYTLVYLNDFGWPVSQKITLYSTQETSYVQYDDAVLFVFKPYKKRKLYQQCFCNCSLAIYDGWLDLDRHVGYQVEKRGEVTIRKSLYDCFDARFFTDSIESLGEPMFEYRHFTVRESDGKVFA